MRSFIYLLPCLLLFGCGNSDTKSTETNSGRLELAEPDKDLREEYEKSVAIDIKDYADEFSNHFTKAGIILRNDSLIFPKESGIEEPALIPTHLELNKAYEFKSNNGFTLKLSRVNYTDIKYSLMNDNILEEGVASLRPSFYLGSESVETSEGGFWLTDYDINTSSYLETIKVGNESYSDDDTNLPYIYITPKNDCEIKQLNEIKDIWKLKSDTNL